VRTGRTSARVVHELPSYVARCATQIVVLALLVLAMINVVGHAGATKRGMSRGRLHAGETRKGSLMLPGLSFSAEGRCAERSDKFDGKTGRCRLSNGVAYGALALQDWVPSSPSITLMLKTIKTIIESIHYMLHFV